MEHKVFGPYERIVKRPLDCILASLVFVVLSPVMVILALMVRLNMGKPVLFAQDRPGKNEKVFKLYKFRTMKDICDNEGNLLPDGDRLTKFGRVLRSSSMDELPELINIIKGDMAIVGPRPLLVRYLPRYNDSQRRRHEVRPGLTGLAQVSGRNAISWEEKFDLDIEYVDKITFKCDLNILLETIKTVIKREGISSESSETMDEFMGNRE